LEIYFGIVVAFVFIYIILGNYIYHEYVIPKLEKIDTSTLATAHPFKQAKQIRIYVNILEKENNKPWFYSCLKNFDAISLVLTLLMLPLFLVVIMEVAK